MFNPKDLSLVGQHQLQYLASILIIASKDNLLALKFKSNDQIHSNDVFIDSLRRTELVVYLLTNAERKAWTQPHVKNSSKVNLQVKANEKKGEKLVNFKTDYLHM